MAKYPRAQVSKQFGIRVGLLRTETYEMTVLRFADMGVPVEVGIGGPRISPASDVDLKGALVPWLRGVRR